FARGAAPLMHVTFPAMRCYRAATRRSAMNPIISELQNAEWSRVFGPTNTLGGQMVQVERDLARQQALANPMIVEPDSSSVSGGEVTGGQVAMMLIFYWPILWVIVAASVSEVLMWMGI